MKFFTRMTNCVKRTSGFRWVSQFSFQLKKTSNLWLGYLNQVRKDSDVNYLPWKTTRYIFTEPNGTFMKIVEKKEISYLVLSHLNLYQSLISYTTVYWIFQSTKCDKKASMKKNFRTWSVSYPSCYFFADWTRANTCGLAICRRSLADWTTFRPARVSRLERDLWSSRWIPRDSF